MRTTDIALTGTDFSVVFEGCAGGAEHWHLREEARKRSLIPWTSPTCILCLSDGRLTVEHAIPAMVGSLKHLASLLKRITDSAFGEGEHAE